jgi:hypothetical protein
MSQRRWLKRRKMRNAIPMELVLDKPADRALWDGDGVDVDAISREAHELYRSHCTNEFTWLNLPQGPAYIFMCMEPAGHNGASEGFPGGTPHRGITANKQASWGQLPDGTIDSYVEDYSAD